jgi:tRNA A-37 threonylcarbamoyl transferase component Bud32
MSPQNSQPDTRRRIGDRYRLDRAIGQGGMGTVWHGYDELLSRDVAVKEVRFPPEVGHEQADLRTRTLREARATARLSHPNVVTTYDVVEEDGRPWIVMELLHVRTLGEILRQDGPLPPYRVAEIGLDMLSALELSHGEGVVHRDVKPGNVLMTDDGRAVLTDFGIATMAGDPALTSTGMVLGSPAYLSPERARGQRPGAAGDMWSLGATLYAAVEGRPPYDGENALATLTQVISDPVDPPTVPGPLRDAILGLLAKDPADRAGVAQTRELLRRAAADRTRTTAAIAPVEPAALDRAGRTEALPLATDGRHRRRGLLALLAALVLVAVVATIAAAQLGSGTGPATQAGQQHRKSSSSPQASHSPTPSASPSQPGNGLPAGFHHYRDATGFSVAVPDGWAVDHHGTEVDIKNPDGTEFLRVDQTDHPKNDPVKDWEEQSKRVSNELPNYQTVSIESVDYRGWPAADWEFTWGTQTHVLDRGFVTGAKGYALYWSAPEGRFDSDHDVFDVAARTFQPASAGGGGGQGGNEGD